MVDIIVDANRASEEPSRITRLERVSTIFVDYVCKLGLGLSDDIEKISLYDHKGILTVTFWVNDYIGKGVCPTGATVDVPSEVVDAFIRIKNIWENVECETESRLSIIQG